MKINILAISLLSFLFLSCIKDEAKNREADILSFSLSEELMLGVEIKDDEGIISIIVRKDADLSSLVPVIELTAGASVLPAANEAQNFSKAVAYTVTSEDGNWSRQYIVVVTSDIGLYFPFEDWNTTGKYPQLSDVTWASGNGGLALINPSTYPTTRTEDCIEGKYAAMLKTQKGGFIELINKNIPIFSGSLFRGRFSALSALTDPLTAPKFGQPHPKDSGKPVTLTGYYKYTVGSPFIASDGTEAPARVDSCTIRGVLFKVTKGKEGVSEYLTAKDILTSNKIVGWADMADCSQQLEFTKFEIPFTYRDMIDYDKYDYKLAVIFASSKYGDNYEGAIGSTLIIDDVSIVCEPFKKDPR